jgi:hypothetical protein
MVKFDKLCNVYVPDVHIQMPSLLIYTCKWGTTAHIRCQAFSLISRMHRGLSTFDITNKYKI